MAEGYRSDLPPVRVTWTGFRGRIKGDETTVSKETMEIERLLRDDSVSPYQTLCRIAAVLQVPWPSADARAGASELEAVDGARLRFAVVELIAALLDEDVSLGEMARVVDSTRQTLSERARGIKEYIPPAAELTNQAARGLVDLLLVPYEHRANEGGTDEEDR